MEKLLLVLVSVSLTSLLGTGAYMLKVRRHLTVENHDRICAPRMELVQKDISFLRESQVRIEKDVAKILTRLGGP